MHYLYSIPSKLGIITVHLIDEKLRQKSLLETPPSTERGRFQNEGVGSCSRGLPYETSLGGETLGFMED